MLHEEAILLQNQDGHITLPIIYVSFPLPQYIENPRYGPVGTMASGYVQCMNYAEGLHFSAFHLRGYFTVKLFTSSSVKAEFLNLRNQAILKSIMSAAT